MTGGDLPESSAAWARACWAAAEPFTLSQMTRPWAAALCEAAGLPGRSAVLIVRAAPLGRAAPAVVGAVLHGFPAERIAATFGQAWATRSPEEVVQESHRAVQEECARTYADLVDRAAAVSDQLTRALVDLDTAGRPLAAANATVAPPEGTWARLWRQLTTLREHRGDGHIAALTAAALRPAEAQVLMVGWGAGHVDPTMLRTSRGLSDEVWHRAVARLVDRGLVEPGGDLTPAGRDLRSGIENSTDDAAAGPYHVLGPGVRDVYDLCEELSRRVLRSGAFPAVTAVGAPWPPAAPTAR